MNKYIAILAVAVIGFSGLLVKVDAQNATSTISPKPNVTVRPNIKDIEEKELRQELSIKEIRGRIVCLAIGACPTDKEATEVLMKAAQIIEVGNDSLKVSIFDYKYKIDIANARLVRHFWGDSEIDEFSPGDIINVSGYLDSQDNYLVHAKTIRNVSIQKRHDIFKGTIESLGTEKASFVLKTENRGSQTVVVTSETRIIKTETAVCKQEPCPPAEINASFSDLQVGMKVIVRGIWDRTLAKIEARVVVIGDDKNPRSFFKSSAQPSISNSESKVDTETAKKKIDEIRKQIDEILGKLRNMGSF